MQDKNIESFIGEFSAALSNNTFAKATVGNYKGPEEQLQKVLLRRFSAKRGELVQFVFRYANKDVAKNFDPAESGPRLARLFDEGFRSARLFTTEEDIQIEIHVGKGAVLSRSKPTFPKAPDLTHDRQKQRPIPPDREYLKLLGISTAEGKIKDKQYAKFRQVNRFVLILEDLLKHSELPKDRPLRVADMGSGKGYLTFALYDHFRNTLGINAVVTGVEERPHLAEMCDAAARTCGFEGLTFTSGRIGSSNVESPDILIALHACDTATDDALYFGISGRAKIIVAAPCCHKELRHELRFPETLAPLNSYGLLLERETESITDGVRAVLLEHCGYSVRMFEFVSPEHTPKNNLIAAVLTDPDAVISAPCNRAREILDTFRISSQRLEYLLAHQDPLSDPESGSQMV